MGKTKCALLDTDFISKLHITRKDEENRLIDRILELREYQFVCHKQIEMELIRHNGTASVWLQDKITKDIIQEFSDDKLITFLHSIYGKNACFLYLSYLKNACNLFDRNLYGRFYARLEQKLNMSDVDFLREVALCDVEIGCDNNLGEIKTYLLQQTLQNQEDIQLYVFCSDDKKARSGLANAGGIPCISAISAFYILKERLGMDREEARQYFDSWMMFHRAKGQTSFKVHKDTKEMQLVKMEGYEIFERIYSGTITILRNGNLKIKESPFK